MEEKNSSGEVVGGVIVWGLILFTVFGGWGWFSSDESKSSTYSGNSFYDTVSDPTYHTDYDYEYNYRTGYSGYYEYNYDVEGYSDSGDYFYGNVDTSGKYGEGYIYDDYGNEMYVETEWVDYGVMEAVDEYGNTYEFEVE